jgi:hypothetical protein
MLAARPYLGVMTSVSVSRRPSLGVRKGRRYIQAFWDKP